MEVTDALKFLMFLLGPVFDLEFFFLASYEEHYVTFGAQTLTNMILYVVLARDKNVQMVFDFKKENKITESRMPFFAVRGCFL